MRAAAVTDRGGGPNGRPSRRCASMIVDDSAVARAVLSRMIACHEDFEIVATAGSAGEALDALKVVRADVILLDVEMPGASGLEALAGNPAHRPRRARPDRLLDGRGRRRDHGARARRRRRRYPAQARHRQFRRPLQRSARRAAAPDRPRRARAPTRSRSPPLSAPIQLRAMPDAPLGCVALRRLDRRASRLARIPARASAADRRADPGHPASAGGVHALFRPPARKRLPAAPPGRPRPATCWSTISSTSRPATPISASSGSAPRSGSGSTASARLRAACRPPIRCSPRSPKPMARTASG